MFVVRCMWPQPVCRQMAGWRWPDVRARFCPTSPGKPTNAAAAYGFIICLPFHAVALLVTLVDKLIPRRLKNWWRRRSLREGKVVSKFIARDVRRDIMVVSAARIDEGLVTGRVRTTNVLYLSKGMVPQSEFEEAREPRIDEMWRWTGKGWGGLPDGTSIVDHLRADE